MAYNEKCIDRIDIEPFRNEKEREIHNIVELKTNVPLEALEKKVAAAHVHWDNPVEFLMTCIGDISIIVFYLFLFHFY
jgi:hypothetical protein